VQSDDAFLLERDRFFAENPSPKNFFPCKQRNHVILEAYPLGGTILFWSTVSSLIENLQEYGLGMELVVLRDMFREHFTCAFQRVVNGRHQIFVSCPSSGANCSARNLR